MKIIISVLLILSSCSFKKPQTGDQPLEGHEKLYSEPDKPELLKLEKDERRIVIASTNDIHGNYDQEMVSFKDQHNKKPQTISIGGKEVISNYFNILRDTFGEILLVDSGDILSSSGQLKKIQNFYHKEKYDAITLGLRDFTLKVPSKMESNAKVFKKFSESSKTPLILSNLYELKTGRAVEWKGTKSQIIKEVNGVKIGIIGLIPDDISTKTPVNNRVGLFIENMVQSTLRHARLLRTLGADFIVVLTHQGIDCGSELASNAKLPLKKVNFEPKRESICDLKSPLGQYLERLPPQLVDVVVGGRINQKMANFVNGTLVMGGFPDGKSFNYAEFVINIKSKEIVSEKVVVHQPVMFCQDFFKETKDCYPDDPSINHSKKIPATFLGNPIIPSSEKKEASVKSVSIPNLKDISKSLITFNADLSYVPASSGDTQLFVMAIKGRDLMRILEEDYNLNRRDHWLPSPFLVNNQELSLSVSGEFNLNKIYRILTDLESMQSHPHLMKEVTSSQAQALMNYSWNSLDEDYVSSSLAAPNR